MMPLYAFVRGDSLALVVLVDARQTVRELAAVIQEAASVRIAPRPRVRVLARGHTLDPELTIAQAGLGALDRVDLVAEEPA
jgi:hypothetical protein